MNGYSEDDTIKLDENGIDEHGCYWVIFTVDYFAEQLPGECCICGAELESGYLCLDGGDEVCEGHIFRKINFVEVS